ncbi:hypothetical protein L1887_60918 [Cichorium endivia]|nr:hypothetical protein L1887_60918 [Cichorium endivia]
MQSTGSLLERSPGGHAESKGLAARVLRRSTDPRRPQAEDELFWDTRRICSSHRDRVLKKLCLPPLQALPTLSWAAAESGCSRVEGTGLIGEVRACQKKRADAFSLEASRPWRDGPEDPSGSRRS